MANKPTTKRSNVKVEKSPSELQKAEALLHADKMRREQGFAAELEALSNKWGVEIVSKQFVRAR